MPKVFISTTTFAQYDQSPMDALKSSGLDIQLNPHGRTLKQEEIPALMADADFLIAGTEPLNAPTINLLKKLKVISRCGVGMDNVDLSAAKAQGIKVFNTPDVVTDAVAELTVTLILDLLRKVSFMDRQVRSGQWKKNMGSLLKGKKVGVIGFGRIGQRVADLVSAFGAQVGFFDMAEKKGSSYPQLAKKDLLAWAEIVTLHQSSGQGSEKEIISAQDIKAMKKGSWVVNASRGGSINEKALAEALISGHLSGAALDVFAEEPYKGKLAELDNVVLTPHVGSYAKEARIAMEKLAVKNLLDAIKAGSIKG